MLEIKIVVFHKVSKKDPMEQWWLSKDQREVKKLLEEECSLLQQQVQRPCGGSSVQGNGKHYYVCGGIRT